MGRVVTQDELILHTAEHKRNGERVVFTNGCFDLLHPGHICLLDAARSEGDVLVVGLNSDASVTKIKGEGRPILCQDERAETLSSLAAVDYVVVFDEPTPLDLIRRLLPNVLVKGSDWKLEDIVGGSDVIRAGGSVKLVDIQPGYSTSAILEKIRNLPQEPTQQ